MTWQGKDEGTGAKTKGRGQKKRTSITLITPGALRVGDPVRPGGDVREQFRDGRPA